MKTKKHRCTYCEQLNNEKENIEISEIRISSAGYFHWCCPIHHCPFCGKLLERYDKDGGKKV